jgi:hypothetical protein
MVYSRYFITLLHYNNERKANLIPIFIPHLTYCTSTSSCNSSSSPCANQLRFTMHPTVLLFSIASVVLSQAISAAELLRRVSPQQVITYSSLTSNSDSNSNSNSLKVPGESPANYCSDPSNDLFQIRRLDFLPTNPRMYVYISHTLALVPTPWLY